MAFRITKVQSRAFPSERDVDFALELFGLDRVYLVELIGSFVCAYGRSASGYQQHLARELEEYLAARLADIGLETVRAPRYSPRLNERGDLGIKHSGVRNSVFVEIEFRPNVEKDLVKFQIGANSGTLAAAVLILALDRNAINPGYTTMPQFAKFISVVSELNVSYPLLLVGIDGEHI